MDEVKALGGDLASLGTIVLVFLELFSLASVT
jgi:hypothetical protein